MDSKKKLLAFAMFVFPAITCFSQTSNKAVPNKAEPISASKWVKSSAAYAELLLKKTELQADLESLVLEYTEEYPKVIEIRFNLGALQKEADRLNKVKPADVSQLTLALGKLIVRKTELETDLWGLQKNYNDAHPDVKRAKRKVEIYEAAIREILG